MRVVVAGAGVAGLALAHALIKHGHEPEVYEAAPELRTTGGAVGLWPGTVAILHELGLRPGGVRLTRMSSWTVRGRKQAVIDLTHAERRYGFPSVHVERRELVERLAEGIPVTFGARVSEVDPAGAEVHFAGGGSARGDVLVGADGRNSVVRQALWGADPARYVGWATWQGFITWPTRPEVLMVVGEQGSLGLTPAGPERQLWWFDVRTGPGRPLWEDEPDPIGRLKELFGDWGGVAAKVLERIEEAGFFPHLYHPVRKVWGAGPATLAGDAAHTMPPTMAQGANQAVEDAWALSRAVGGDLRAYERERARIVARSARMAATGRTDKPTPVAGLVPDGAMTRFFTWWLRQASSYLLTPR
ncbi:FAD-dependent oxidoreductase [Nonomuraea typhae]|uniref:FAD-dependent oxidoreductase n=1 Tax=Nonomuraea typhae TaxID=2603600 RepID=A0ABW7YS78_9ACTN